MCNLACVCFYVLAVLKALFAYVGHAVFRCTESIPPRGTHPSVWSGLWIIHLNAIMVKACIAWLYFSGSFQTYIFSAKCSIYSSTYVWWLWLMTLDINTTDDLWRSAKITLTQDRKSWLWEQMMRVKTACFTYLLI